MSQTGISLKQRDPHSEYPAAQVKQWSYWGPEQVLFL
jgi:hypothetical protein